MKLPEFFQFRSTSNLGFTHTCKKNAVGDYEVEWAKGWLKLNNNIDPWIVATEGDVESFVGSGGWVVVDDTPKTELKNKLPDEFYFVNPNYRESWYKAVRNADKFQITWPGDDEGIYYSPYDVANAVKNGCWQIIEHAPLTPEQKARNQEFRERIEQLEKSIELQNMKIQNSQMLVDSYKNTIEDLKAKIVEGM